jgi:hypothetical protein
VAAGPRLDKDAILDALREARTFVSASPAGPQLYLEPGGNGVRVTVRGGRGVALLLVTDGGPIAAAAVSDPGEWTATYAVPRDATYVRAARGRSRRAHRAHERSLWR